MRIALVLALAALPLASTANAGGIPGITFPHLTWPETDSQPEVPTRQCTTGIVVTADSETPCPTKE